MDWIVRDDREIPFYVPPPSWSAGQEKMLVHSLVEADSDAVEQLWEARTSPARLGAFLLERGDAYVREQLVARCEVDEETFARVLGELQSLFPQRRAWWANLDRTAIPALCWRRIEQGLVGVARLRQLDAPPVLLDAADRALSQLVLALLEPERVGFGAGYDSRRGLLEDAVVYAARQPLHDIGLRESVEYLGARARAVLSRKPASRAFAGIETYWIVQRRDAKALRARLNAIRPSDHEEQAHLAKLTKALGELDGVWLMSTTKWHDYGLASGSDLEPSSLSGVCRVAHA